jgi:transposase-like protein
MKRSRRNHSPGFKAKLALQAIRGDKALAELAQQQQVHPTQISARKHQLERRLDTHDQAITEILRAIRLLMAPPVTKKRPIGFVMPEEKEGGN